MKNFGRGPGWLGDKVVNCLGLVFLDVELPDGHIVCRHVDHIRMRTYLDAQVASNTNDVEVPLSVFTETSDNSPDTSLRCIDLPALVVP